MWNLRLGFETPEVSDACRARCEAMAQSSSQLAGWVKTSSPLLQIWLVRFRTAACLTNKVHEIHHGSCHATLSHLCCHVLQSCLACGLDSAVIQDGCWRECPASHGRIKLCSTLFNKYRGPRRGCGDELGIHPCCHQALPVIPNNTYCQKAPPPINTALAGHKREKDRTIRK